MDIIRAKRNGRDDIALTAQGFIAETLPRHNILGAYALTTQRLEGCLIGLRSGDVVTNVHCVVSTAGTSVTVARIGLYSTAGVLLASCANTTTIATDAASFRSVALSSPYTVTADGGYYVAILAVFTGTAPQLLRGVSQTNALDAAGSGSRGAVSQTGQADLPDPATFGASGSAVWFGVS